MEIKLDKIFDFKKVDALLEGFNKTTGFVTAILDLNGEVLSKSGWRDVCTQFHRVHPTSAHKCLMSDTFLANQMAKGEKYHFYECMNGLVDVAVPIVIEGVHIANLFSGQFFFKEPDMEFFRKQAEKFGFNVEEYITAISHVPIIPEEKVIDTMNFLLQMTEIISEMGFQNLQLEEFNSVLTESEERFYKIFESNPIPISIVEDGTRIITHVNNAWCQLFDYTSKEAIGSTHKKLQIISPETRDLIISELRSKGRIDGLEIDVYTKSGIKKNIFINNVPILIKGNQFVLNLMIDNTEKKEAEIEIENHKRLLETVINCIPAAICVLDGTEFRIKLINQSYRDIAPGMEMLGNTWGELWKDSDHDFNAICKNVIVTGEPFVVFDDKNTIKRAPDLPVEDAFFSWSLHRIQLPENNEFGLLGTVWETTKFKKIEDAIIKLNNELEAKVKKRTAELEASNKELESFSYSVSHDLRAPLRHINGYVDLLNDRFKDDLPEKAQHYLSVISKASNQMGVLIDELLLYSRTGRQEMNRIEFDLNDLIHDILEKFHFEVQGRVIHWNIDQLPKIYADYTMLKQVWINLIDNAIKYTRNNSITNISIGFSDDKGHFTFFIQDNGVGFNMKYAGKLFGVFQRLHSQTEFEGTGIGLANVQRIIHKHGGKVWVEAEIDQGATFYFTLPKNILKSPWKI